MANETTRRSWVPLAGLLFVVLTFVSFVIGGESPDSDAGVREVVDYWTDHDDANMIASVVEALGAVLLLFFAAYLYQVVKGWVDGGVLPVAALAGGVVAVGGIGVDAAIRFAAADVAGEVEPATLQTLSAMWANFFWPMVIGVASLILATSLAGWRQCLPKWFAVIGVLIFIAFFTPAGFFAFLVGAVWIIVLSVMLWLRSSASPAPAPGPAPA